MRLLFITRTFLPLKGGMERFASDFFHYYQKLGKVDLIANRRGLTGLLAFLLRTILYLIRNAEKYDIVHFGDASLSILFPIVRWTSRAKLSVTVHGLDVVYPNFIYQMVIPFFLRRADRLFAVSQFTKRQCNLRGIKDEIVKVIPNGISRDEIKSCLNAERVLTKFRIPDVGKKRLLTVGRLIRRKGHAWFISSVMTKLPNDIVYIIAGIGPEHRKLKQLLTALKLGDRVFLVGEVSEEEKACLYTTSDLFIMPNIHVPGDQEGFGIVLLEAGMYGLPVIASRIEGIPDAVIEGKTGRLVDESDAKGFIKAITKPGLDKRIIPDTVSSNFDWRNLAIKYHYEFRKLINPRFEHDTIE